MENSSQDKTLNINKTYTKKKFEKNIVKNKINNKKEVINLFRKLLEIINHQNFFYSF